MARSSSSSSHLTRSILRRAVDRPGSTARADAVFWHDRQITIERNDDDITVDGLWTYAWSATRRPFVHPLRTPAGMVLSCDAPADHPWHHGLWFTIKFVNGENFWEEYDEYGVLRHDGPPRVDTAHGAVAVAGSLRWIRPDRESVIVHEHRSFTYRALPPDAYVLAFETRLVPTADVVFDRTPFTTWGGYGGLTLRGAAEWSDTRLLLADGDERQQVHGVRARWCDLSSARGGVTWFDHPDNPRYPTPWYGSTRADTYGEGWANFVNAAFLWHEPLAVRRGEPLTLRYHLVVHDGAWAAERIEACASQLGTPGFGA